MTWRQRPLINVHHNKTSGHVILWPGRCENNDQDDDGYGSKSDTTHSYILYSLSHLGKHTFAGTYRWVWLASLDIYATLKTEVGIILPNN